jgi:phosphoesterase RecJ-like protein
VNWVSAARAFLRRIDLPAAQSRALADHQADCRLLFTAISTDTGSFQYPTTRPGTFHAGAELVTRGANLAKICDEVYQSYPLSRARLLKHAYSKFRLTPTTASPGSG